MDLMNSNLLVRLIAMLIEKLPEVRKTLLVCVAACCDWAATKLINFLFSQYDVAFWTFTLLLHSFLIVYSIKFIFRETFEDDLRNQLAGRLAALLGGKPADGEGKSGEQGDGSKPSDAPAAKDGAPKTQRSAKASTPRVKRKVSEDKAPRKTARRPPAGGALEGRSVEEVAEAGAPTADKPRQVQPRINTRDLEN